MAEHHPTIDTFDPGQIAMRVEIPGVYDGIAAYLMRDGSWVNRFRLRDGWGERRAARTDEWIGKHGAGVRMANLDLLDADVERFNQ